MFVPKISSTKPGLGVGVIILNSAGQVLIGKRLKDRCYGFPGGHLENYESWEDCTSRETREETGLKIQASTFKLVCVQNVHDEKKDYHYLSIIMISKCPEDQEPKNIEPTSCEGWEWWDVEELFKRRDEMFLPIQRLLEKDVCLNLRRLCKMFAI